ncbi:hypothetical protein [Mangrovicoccus sp. HB161399]|uniref:hypothetical protein n=1 Tax=Mangrovicoccus sp. HB161399 TaxID=2720392 RepID=UPI0015578ACD|nr:hypothetical protein [Mangrovicoccus sp. HB161399]
MTGAPASEAAMLAALRDIHLPLAAPGGTVAEIAAAVAVGGAAAIAAALLLRLATRRRPRPAPETLAASLDRLAGAPEDVRRIELLRLMKARAPDRFAALCPDLYRPGPVLASELLERELRGLA